MDITKKIRTFANEILGKSVMQPRLDALPYTQEEYEMLGKTLINYQDSWVERLKGWVKGWVKTECKFCELSTRIQL